MEAMMTEPGGSVNVGMGFFKNLFDYVLTCYQDQRFCDVKLYAPLEQVVEDGLPEVLGTISCHSLVLCSVAPAFKNLLLEIDFDVDQGARCVFLPGLCITEIAKFLDEVYQGLCEDEFMLDISYDLADAMGMLVEGQPFEIKESDDINIILPDRLDISRVILDHREEDVFENARTLFRVPKMGQVDSQQTAVPPVGRKIKSIKTSFGKRKRGSPYIRKAGVPEGDVTGLRSLGHARMPVVRKVDNGDCKYSREIDHKLEDDDSDVMLRLMNQEGSFVASIGTPYATPNVTDSKDNVMTDNPLQQFRMRLPDSRIVSFVAVGVGNDGKNYATRLAMKEGDSATNFNNLINATKKICGTSYGLILRHKRIMDAHSDKFSETAIEEARFNLLDKAPKDREEELQRSKSIVDEFDTEDTAITFHHLPTTVNNEKLQFHLTGDLNSYEVMDYALLEGGNLENLKLRGFFNFYKTKMTNQRLLTIMLDTISCFLGMGTSKPLHDHPLVVNTVEIYSSKTCQLLSCQQTTSKKPRRKCMKLLSDTYLEKPSQEEIKASEEDPPPLLMDGLLETDTTTKRRRIIRRTNLTDGDPGDESKPYQCKFSDCSRGFNKVTEMAGHIARVHGKKANYDRAVKNLKRMERGEPKVCTECGKAVKGAKDLRDHIYYHHNKKTCVWCNLEFPGAYLFYYHNNKVHYEKLECDVCHQTFKGREKLRLHKINKHLEDHQKPYVCNVCGKGYAAKTKLQSHQMNVHIRSRPYKCRLEGCDADFNELANRNAHEKGVHKFNYKEVLENDKKLMAEQDSIIVSNSIVGDIMTSNDPTIEFVQVDDELVG